MTHGRARQCTIAIPALEHRDDLPACILVGKSDYILGVSRKERGLHSTISLVIRVMVWLVTYGNTTVMALHPLMFVLARIESGADQHDRLSCFCPRLVHKVLRLVEQR